MTIREAVIADVPRIVEMGQTFLAASPYRAFMEENPAQFAALATQCIEDPEGVVFLAEMGEMVVGMIVLVLFVHPLSAQRTAGELCWWVEPAARGAGLRLLTAAEAWALGHGAGHLQMVAPTPQVAKIYERFGYQLAEIAYVKALA